MGDDAVDFGGALPAAGIHRPQQGGAAGHQVVHDDGHPVLHVTDHRFPADLTLAAALFQEGGWGLVAGAFDPDIPEPVRALGAAGVRRHDHHRPVADVVADFVHEQAVGFQVQGAAAEGVVEGGPVVHLQRHHAVHPHGFEKLAHVAGGDRIVVLGAAILAGVGQVGQQGGDPGGAGVPHRGDEKQQRQQLVVDRGVVVAEQGVQHIDITTANTLQRPGLVFAIAEIPVFVFRQADVQLFRHRLAERLAALQSEQYRFAVHRFSLIALQKLCTAPTATDTAGGSLVLSFNQKDRI